MPGRLRRDTDSWRPWEPSCATQLSCPCVRPQVSPTMTAEELTNQVLEMRNVAASLDIWLTFEALENGELGEPGGMALGHGQAGEGEVWGTGAAEGTGAGTGKGTRW